MPGKEELEIQRAYWNKEITQFDAIYSHKKSRLSNWLDAVFRKDMYQRFEYTMKNAEPITDRTFLDVGCGTGIYTFELIQRGCRHVTGIDISDVMIEQCNAAALKQHVQDKVTFVVGDLVHYPVGEKVDVCIGIGLFDYIENPQPVLDKMRQCTRDKVIMSFPRFWTWRAPVRKVRLSLRGCPVYFYTQESVQTLLLNAGFESYTIEKVGKLFCVTASLKN